MFASRVLDQAEHKARRAGASAVRLVTASLLALLSGAFLTCGAWIYLSARFDDLLAALVIGGFFGVLAACVLLIKPRFREPPPKPQVGVDDLLQAFLAAAQVGRSTRR